ncbi:MAG: hypothetical protein ACRDRL_25895, partial [Sciscionella sp.]
QRTAREIDRAALAAGFELACQRFAASFFEHYDHLRAYKAVHPSMPANRQRTTWLRTAASAYLDKRTRRGRRTVEILTEMWRPVEQVGIDLRLLVEWIVEPYIIDYSKFYREGDDGQLEAYVQPTLTHAEFRQIKRLKTTNRHYPKLGMTITTTELELRDPGRGIDQAIALMALHHRINAAEDGANPLPDELTKVLEHASRNRQKFLERLPPSRVRTTIEGKASPAS